MKSAGIISKSWSISFNDKDNVRHRSFLGLFSIYGADRLFFLIVFFLVLFGLLMVYSASFIYAQERTGNGFYFIAKQVLFSCLGFFILIFACKMDYRKWFDWHYIILAIATMLLVLVMIPGIGTKIGGAQRWIRLGFINFQPGEFAKFALILFVSAQLAKKHERLDRIAAGVLSPFLLSLPVIMLLLAQPDFGTVALISTVIFFLMYIAGVPKKYLFVVILILTGIGTYLAFGTPYRKLRLQTFLNPWSDPAGKGFQILQSFVGFHN
ncbi:MAG: FtsW/RodA/SpoVE family cell cycle protein, partial [Bdellovibrio sp.]|nr:FtsW/RodA/SpoVE family cell cycle protein [Bdellovibrio sp.]